MGSGGSPADLGSADPAPVELGGSTEGIEEPQSPVDDFDPEDPDTYPDDFDPEDPDTFPDDFEDAPPDADPEAQDGDDSGTTPPTSSITVEPGVGITVVI